MRFYDLMSREERVARHQLVVIQRMPANVTFLVGNTKEKVPCHKEILMEDSEIFEAMFRNCWDPKTQKEISIPDADLASFMIFTRFLYTKTTQLTEDTADVVLCLAHKYEVKNLESLCARYLMTHINLENVLRVYTFARLINKPCLVRRSFAFMLRNAEDFFKSTHLLELDLYTFQHLLFSDNLKAEELIVFKAAIRWAENVCAQKGQIPCTPRNKRKVMKPLLPLIRFTLLTLPEFTREVTHKNPGLLTKAEALKLTRYFKVNSWANPAKKVNLNYNVNARGDNRHFVAAYGGITSKLTLPDHTENFESYWFGCKNQDVRLTAVELFEATLKPGYENIETVRIRLEIHVYSPINRYVIYTDCTPDEMKSGCRFELSPTLTMEKNTIYALRFYYPEEFDFKFGSNIRKTAYYSCTPTDVLEFMFINMTHRNVLADEGRLKGIHFRR